MEKIMQDTKAKNYAGKMLRKKIYKRKSKNIYMGNEEFITIRHDNG